jgi:hypothetical protein
MPASRILITSTFQMSFPNLLKPRAFQEAPGKAPRDPRYSVDMLYEPSDLEHFKIFDEKTQAFVDVDVRRVAAAVAKEEWPDLNAKEAVAAGVLGWPVKDGDDYADKRDLKGKKGNDHFRGKKIIAAKANEEYPPRLYHAKSGKREQIVRGTTAGDQLAGQLFYGGAFAFAEITVKAVLSGENKYVTCYLNSIKFMKDGERLGGGSVMDRFDGIDGGESDIDPTGGADTGGDLDAEIPF